MSERISQPVFDINRSVRFEIRPERFTSAAGALLLREIMPKLRFDRWLGGNLVDFGREDLVTPTYCKLLRTKLILLGQGWRENDDDADFLGHDPCT